MLLFVMLKLPLWLGVAVTSLTIVLRCMTLKIWQRLARITKVVHTLQPATLQVLKYRIETLRSGNTVCIECLYPEPCQVMK